MAIHPLDTKIYVGQKAFINRGGKILLLKDEVGLDFPGGKYRWGEDLAESLHREVTEETGLQIKIGEPFATWTNKGVTGVKNDIFYIGYLCEYLSGDVVISDEHNYFEWVSQEKIEKWNNGSGHFKALEKYFNLFNS